MVALTFAEQVKIILSRRRMTIKELAEVIEEKTGKKMSRQNLTQRLNRDNFQEQDMRMIAGILGCAFQLNILDKEAALEEGVILPTQTELEKVNRRRDRAMGMDEDDKAQEAERDITMGELVDMMNVAEAEIDRMVEDMPEQKELPEEPEARQELEMKPEASDAVIKTYIKNSDGEKEMQDVQPQRVNPMKRPGFTFGRPSVHRPAQQPVSPEQSTPPAPEEEDTKRGEINPYTGLEYKSNSVRIHPQRIGYVQVYDRSDHKWTDMTEWAFLGYQERKKALLGNDYEPPIYLD